MVVSGTGNVIIQIITLNHKLNVSVVRQFITSIFYLIIIMVHGYITRNGLNNDMQSY